MSLKCIVVLLVAALALLQAQSLSQVPFRTVEAYWSFGDGLNDWATSSTAAMEAEVDVNGGLLHGVALGESPYIDSPLLELEVDDRHYLVLRMAYDGLCSTGRVLLDRGPVVGTFTNRKAQFERPTTYDFSILSDGAQHIYYIPIYTLGDETIRRIRLYPCATRAQLGQSFSVDWIQIIKAPTITKVRGCIDQYFATSARTSPVANVTLQTTKTNGVHPRFTSLFGRLSLPYATTYNCMANDTIAIQGRHFGDTAIVHINGQPCLGPSTIHAPTLASDAFEEEVLRCTLPPNALDGPNPAVVTVINEAFRGLRIDMHLVAYAQPVTLTQAPTLSNVAAHAMDVTWAPPSDIWQSLATTGYRVTWTDGSSTASVVVGNVTTTTIRPLAANATYNVTVTALVENQRTAAWQDVDLYGRRAMDVTAVVGSPSPLAGPAVRTLLHDIGFTSFSAAAILNNSATYPHSTLGPTGDAGGQGAFGLVLLGHANVQNCNSTSICCDIRASTNACYLTCAALPMATARSSATASLTTIRNSSDVTVPPAVLPLPPCGPALRLTGSAPLHDDV
ncbi:hypothetical protein SPRG_18636 [Saprolegnia parasitica CBS 223.65]|uniref:Fibronectin type-III domain-containing protein n=1 Tax=Saprolegnia parasitica (strain CBS 223.65) TaxID=695850 RepID=A0A067BM75_SAPPC|nr:hypothetical protein SPRG_18636 [Saprolegnia parasitica CBS 223.65]KDO15827.1 hypothetical protein SPRG_18636 [Saprolegnia parasitica CBS 223.65]|eukprot:XP_012213465.1 hypothetical protein SPRG_18636 [Saprolegnia parasitica CBS 223.65]